MKDVKETSSFVEVEVKEVESIKNYEIILKIGEAEIKLKENFNKKLLKKEK